MPPNNIKSLKPIFCHKCKKCFWNKISLSNHMIVDHTDLKNIKCTFCHKMFANKADFNLHLKHVSNGRSQCENTNENPQNYKNALKLCTFCNKVFKNESDFVLHLKHVSGGLNQCEYSKSIMEKNKLFKNPNPTNSRKHEASKRRVQRRKH